MRDSLLECLVHENHIIPQFPAIHIISKENDDFRDTFLDEIWIYLHSLLIHFY